MSRRRTKRRVPNIQSGLGTEEAVRFVRDQFKVLSLNSPEAEARWRSQPKQIDDEEEHRDHWYASPDIVEDSLKSKIGLENSVQRRYELEGKLGEGTYSNVFSFRDGNCHREVAVKMLKPVQASTYPEEVNRFMREAGAVATLEHPFITPVYDVDVDQEGRVYMSMRKIEGYSLREYIQRGLEGKPCSRIPRLNELINVFIKACSAIAYAHSKGYIHQDLKPENIIVGKHGEVNVVDWAATANLEEIALTPAYMSPQQARGEPITIADDIYCLGATLFHCLFLRVPADAETMEELWLKRRMGTIDAPTPEEEKNVPRGLLDICLALMTVEPADRYESLEDLIQDLRDFQQRQVQDAYCDSVWKYVSRMYRARRSVYHGLAALLFVVAMSGFGFHHALKKDSPSWHVAAEERFDASWRGRWQASPKQTRTENGKLILDGMAMYKEKLRNPVAVEFVGRVPDGEKPGDLSVVWQSSLKAEPETETWLRPQYLLQVGAWDNSYSGITQKAVTKGTGRTHAYSNFKLGPTQEYRIRAEIDGEKMRLLVNGNLLCEATVLFPLREGYVGLYGATGEKMFSDVRIYTKPVSRTLKSTAIGDAFFGRARYDEAMKQYEEVIRCNPGTGLAIEAQYKKGVCWQRLGDTARAFEAWQGLLETPFGERVQIHLLERMFANADYTRVRREILRLHPDASPWFKGALGDFWSRSTSALIANEKLNNLNEYIALGDRLFAERRVYDFVRYQALMSSGEYERVVREFRHFPWAHSLGLIRMGRFQEVLEMPKSGRDAFILLSLGQFEEILRRDDMSSEARAMAHWSLGNFDEAYALSKKTRIKTHGEIAVAAEKAQDLLDVDVDQPELGAEALLALGRADEVPDFYPNEPELCAQALFRRGLYSEVSIRYPEDTKLLAEALYHMGRFDELIRRCPEESNWVVKALLASNRAEEVLKRYPRYRNFCAQALFHLGRYEELLRKYPYQRPECAAALVKLGRGETVIESYVDRREACSAALLLNERGDVILARFNDLPERRAEALFQLGRRDDVLTETPFLEDWVAKAMLYNGQADRILARYGAYEPLKELVQTHEALESIVDGTKKTMSTIYVGVPGAHEMNLFGRHVLPPFLMILNGDAFDARKIYWRAIRRLKLSNDGRPTFLIRYILGSMQDDEFMRMPKLLYVEGDLLLAKAMRAEHLARPGALDFYRRFMALPAGRREMNPVIDRFVNWRIRVLSEEKSE